MIFYKSIRLSGGKKYSKFPEIYILYMYIYNYIYILKSKLQVGGESDHITKATQKSPKHAEYIVGRIYTISNIDNVHSGYCPVLVSPIALRSRTTPSNSL